jgi:hypothetical protein
MGKVVSYKRNPDGEVKLSKMDRKIAKKIGFKLGRKKIISVSKYAKFLNKAQKK